MNGEVLLNLRVKVSLKHSDEISPCDWTCLTTTKQTLLLSVSTTQRGNSPTVRFFVLSLPVFITSTSHFFFTPHPHNSPSHFTLHISRTSTRQPPSPNQPSLTTNHGSATPLNLRPAPHESIPHVGFPQPADAGRWTWI